MASLVVISIFITGCASSMGYVGSDAKSQRSEMSMGLDQQDLVDAGKKCIQDFLDNEGNEIKSSQLIVIGNIMNDTTAEVDMNMLIRGILNKLRRAHKFRVSSVVAGSAGSQDATLDKMRNLKNDENVDQTTTVEGGDIKQPNYILTGRINEVISNTRKKHQKHAYSITLTIKDIHKVELWSLTTPIQKVQ